MKKGKNWILCICTAVTLLISSVCPVGATSVTGETQAPETSLPSVEIAAPSAVLMEASTGTILFEKNAHEKMRPASITKVMTLLLIFEALESGNIKKEDTVTVSEHAASMGGSQVFLGPGETQTVNDMIKCISICSANDACVAMAEHIGGSEGTFVSMMNEKAKTLGMNDTNFVNCCGLEADGHLTSAYDIALMSRELTRNHPDIFNYCTIWMDTITHTTRKGTSEFGLTNTNKLLRYYTYTTGLKTGYTSQSKYCLSATATRDNVDLISVVMAEESPTIRNKDSVTLLNYGFAHCSIYQDANDSALPNLPVKRGTADTVPIAYESEFRYVLTDGSAPDAITKEIDLPTEVKAPAEKGNVAGKAVYYLGDKEIGSVNILYQESVPRSTLGDCFLENLRLLFLS